MHLCKRKELTPLSTTSLLQQTSLLPEYYRSLTRADMKAQIITIKKRLGSKLFIPEHNYQKDEVIQFADATGDSL